MSIQTTIIIPTWNGEKLLKKNLPVVLKNITSTEEVLVIENGSTDGSVEYLKQLKADENNLKVIFNQKNLGFIKACNQGVKQANGKYICLLNNDVYPKENFLAPAVNHFSKRDVFAVSLNEIGDEWSGWAKIFWDQGFFNYRPGGKAKQAHISGWASGGGAVYRKSMWQKLQGFDMLYHPYYWEDLDIGYRAWKKGWRILWEPEARVVHDHQSTISKLDRDYVDLIKQRNQLLFIWKNIDNSSLKRKHYLGLISRAAMGPNYIKVIFAALKRYQRFKPKKKVRNPRKTDIEILNMFQAI